MKNLIIFMFVLLLGLGAQAQTQAVFLNYDYPPKKTLLDLAMGYKAVSPKEKTRSLEYGSILIEAVKDKLSSATTANIVDVFSYLSYEEVTLEEGSYYNSGWNPTTQKMEKSKFPGHKWQGMCWVFRYKDIAFVLIKGDCGNVVFCPLFDIPKQDKLSNENKNDNKSKGNVTNITNNYYQNSQQHQNNNDFRNNGNPQPVIMGPKIIRIVRFGMN